MRRLLIICFVFIMFCQYAQSEHTIITISSGTVFESNSNSFYLAARDTADSPTTSAAATQIYNTFNGVDYYIIWRAFLPIDTSTLTASAEIDSAKLVGYVTAKDVTEGDFSLRFIQGTFTGALATGWYNDFEGWAESGVYNVTDIADSVSTTTFSAEDTLRVTLNATGLANINKTGTTAFALLHGNDVNNVEPATTSYVSFTDDGMYLEIWYDAGFNKSVMGVPSSSAVSGVPREYISAVGQVP